MKKYIIGFIVVVIVLAAIGGGLAYARSIGMIDLFLTPEQKEQREITRLRKLFPDNLGTYELYGRNPEKIQVRSECNKIEDHPDTRGIGLTGELCGQTVSGEYRDTVNKKVVFIHLSQATKGGDLYRTLLQKIGKEDRLGSQPILRVERHEIAWFPTSGFDIIFTQEGTLVLQSNGAESMGYGAKASGNNPVTQYFINKYPPATGSETSKPISDRVNINATQCVDTDGGQDYFVKGKVTCGSRTYTDYCSVNDVPGMLVEYVTNGGNGVGTPSYVCPKGCRDGACIK